MPFHMAAHSASVAAKDGKARQVAVNAATAIRFFMISPRDGNSRIELPEDNARTLGSSVSSENSRREQGARAARVDIDVRGNYRRQRGVVHTQPGECMPTAGKTQNDADAIALLQD